MNNRITFLIAPVTRTLLCVGLLFSVQANALGAEKNTKTTITKPMAGPVLSGPIVRPGVQKPKDLASPGNGPTDLAFGAYQRGYYLTALELALPRAETGDPAAQTLIGELYWKGLGVGRDPKRAVKWYQFAANGGSREAQFAYANILLRGKIVKEDKNLGEEFMRKAAKAGHRLAQFNVAQIITARRPTWASFKKALPFYKAAAQAGIPDAQYALANIYAEAKGVRYNDEIKALKWLRASAKGGLDTAQVELGIWLANGRGTGTEKKTDGKKFPIKARFWFIKAAIQGNVIAQNRLARLYSFGIGTEIDLIKGGAWHILSRRAGFSDSEMDRVFQSQTEIDKKRTLEAANQLSNRMKRIGR